MGDLVVNNSINVETDHGPCLVELCLGSITALKVKDRVDTLVISAFPGDYTPTPTSVVGALQKDLGISVKQLARDKEEDLRKLFSCWWSKPLRDGLPYGRILCFEGSFKRSSTPPSTVSEVFRSLVSLAKNKDMTAILPLLAAGDQGYNKTMMLRLIVDAAINWMQTGLPLKLLKIVLFSRDPHNPGKDLLKIGSYFQELKNEWLEKWKEEKEDRKIIHDVYLSYSCTDKSFVDKICEGFKENNQSLKIFTKHLEVDKDSSWQEEMYEVIKSCARVVALLTPSYIQEDACIEQFNIAMCCSRKKNILVPFYVKAIVQMPTYMGLIQYMDCRSQDSNTISNACSMVSASFTVESVRSTLEDKLIASSSSLHEVYDVFISYSHRDMAVATRIVDHIKTTMPDWNIFFDQKDLRVGSTWQLKLYSSIENTQYMVALISEDYMESKVCQEEYNLARSMHDDSKYPTRLIEIKLSAVEEWPIWCTPTQLFDLTDKDVYPEVTNLVDDVITEVKCGLAGGEASLVRAKPYLPITEVTSSWRKAIYAKSFPITIGSNYCEVEPLSHFIPDSEDKYDIILSYHPSDKKYADVLVKDLLKLIPGLRISLPDVDGTLRLHEIDRGQLIVPLLSAAYVRRKELMEEFHTALCRHRFSEEIVIFPIIVDELPPSPVFPQIVFTLFAVTDEIWCKDKRGSDGNPCLYVAAIVICNILVKDPKVLTAFRTLFSMRELRKSTETIMKTSKVSTTLRSLFSRGEKSTETSESAVSLQLPLAYHSKIVSDEITSSKTPVESEE